jgi:lipopolysaccharide export system protein LptA
LTVTGDVAVNGGDITTTSATFNLANAASTLNLGTTGIIRTVNIGTGTGSANTNAQTINIGTFSTNSATIRIGNYNSTPASTTTIHGDTLNLNATDTNGTTNICASGANLGFFGVAASTQYTTTGTTLGFTAGVGTAARVDSTYTGNNGTKAYTVGDIVRALKSYGLLDVS